MPDRLMNATRPTKRPAMPALLWPAVVMLLLVCGCSTLPPKVIETQRPAQKSPPTFLLTPPPEPNFLQDLLLTLHAVPVSPTPPPSTPAKPAP